MKNRHNSLLAFLMLFLSQTLAFAQSDSAAIVREDSHYDQVFVSVQEMPEFPGGMDSLFKYLGAAINYPEEAKAKNLQGIVYVYFVIEKDGNISNVEVRRGVKDAPMLDAEALRAIKTFPQWKPGKQNGKNVRVAFTVPVKFFLQDKQKK
jgi:periplasmic protein TonB